MKKILKIFFITALIFIIFPAHYLHANSSPGLVKAISNNVYKTLRIDELSDTTSLLFQSILNAKTSTFNPVDILENPEEDKIIVKIEHYYTDQNGRLGEVPDKTETHTLYTRQKLNLKTRGWTGDNINKIIITLDNTAAYVYHYEYYSSHELRRYETFKMPPGSILTLDEYKKDIKDFGVAYADPVQLVLSPDSGYNYFYIFYYLLDQKQGIRLYYPRRPDVSEDETNWKFMPGMYENKYYSTLDNNDPVFDFLWAHDYTVKVYHTTEKYSITYNYNAPGDGFIPIDTSKYAPGSQALINSRPPTRTGYYFIGWNTQKDGSGDTYFPGDAFTITQNILLYAQWAVTSADGYRVIYEKNGATYGSEPVDTTRYAYGDTVKVKDQGDLEKDSYVFTAWNTKINGEGTRYYPSDTFEIGKDTILYAQWVFSSGPPIVLPPTTKPEDEDEDNNGSSEGSGEIVTNPPETKEPEDNSNNNENNEEAELPNENNNEDEDEGNETENNENIILPGTVNPQPPDTTGTTNTNNETGNQININPPSTDNIVTIPQEPAVTTPVIPPPEDITPIAEYNTWSLANMLITFSCILISLWFSYEIGYRYRRIVSRWNEQNTNKLKLEFELATISTGIVAIIVFFETQDLNSLMAIFDRYTLIMALILLVQVSFTVAIRRNIMKDFVRRYS